MLSTSSQVTKTSLATQVGNETAPHDVKSGMCVFGGKALVVGTSGDKPPQEPNSKISYRERLTEAPSLSGVDIKYESKQ